MSDFDTSFRWGQKGEKRVAKYIMATDKLSLMPVYDMPIRPGKGPQVFTLGDSYAAPDMLLFDGTQARWAEVKSKRTFTWHYHSSTWQVGIGLNHFEDYKNVADKSPWPVRLYFYMTGGEPTPEGRVSPTGLYYGDLDDLKGSVHHKDDESSYIHMAYWTIHSLIFKCSLEEMDEVINKSRVT